MAPAAAAVPDPPRAEHGVADETAMKSDEKPDSPDEIEEIAPGYGQRRIRRRRRHRGPSPWNSQ